jgi:hypothetical protein
VEVYLNIAAMTVSLVALAVSYLSWLASRQANRAAIFDRRFESYSDAERFIRTWMRHGRPNLDELGMLIAAWTRSHFLCSKPVTDYQRSFGKTR